MRKSGQEIEDIVVSHIQELIDNGYITICGSVYAKGERPFNSQAEDCIVSFLTGDMDQVQEGDVVVNVYVADVQKTDGSFYPNKTRCLAIEQQLIDLDEMLNELGDIHFTYGGAIYTIEEESIKQHFVTAQLHFKYLSV